MRKEYLIFSGSAILLFLLIVNRSALGSNFNPTYLLLIPFLLAFLTTPLVSKLAFHFKILDYPDARKVHRKPIPRIGGVAIYLSFAVAILCNYDFSVSLKGVGLGATLIFLLGLVDDIRPVPAAVKLLVQLVACLVLIHYEVLVTFFPSQLWWGHALSVLITIVWVLGITNSINYMDGLDGLVAGLGIICALFFSIIAVQTGQIYLAYLSIALMGSLSGFLLYNTHPASIFLGDSGSTLIGFVLASLAIKGYWSNSNPVISIGTPLLLLSLPICDLVYTTISRIHRGATRNLSQVLSYTGKDHLHHRLLDHGFTHQETVLFIYFMALTFGMGSLILRRMQGADLFLMLVQLIFTFLTFSILMQIPASRKN